ncbi:hypothetical protein RUND412_003168 [Rhizina undulata]
MSSAYSSSRRDSGARVPFSFHQEKWLFLHVTGYYPFAGTVDWDTVAEKYKARFPVGRIAGSLESKWKEMMERGVNIDFYEHGEEPPLIHAQPPANPTVANHHVPAPAVYTPSSAARTSSQIPQDSRDSSTSSDDQLNYIGLPYTAEETNWLLEWLRLNTVPGEKKNWSACDMAFTKKFKYSRGPAALKLKHCRWKKKGVATSSTEAGKKRKSISPSPESANKRSRQDGTAASSSAFVALKEKAFTKALVWTPAQEEWLMSHCSENYPGQKVDTINWKRVAEAYGSRWGIGRSPGGVKRKWTRKMRESGGVTGEIDEHVPEEVDEQVKTGEIDDDYYVKIKDEG